jgi:biotin carboxyl carrier protein
LNRYEVLIGNRAETIELERYTNEKDEGEAYQCQIIEKKGSKTRRLVVRRRDPNFLLISLNEKLYWIRQSKRTTSLIEFTVNGKKVLAKVAGNEASTEGTTMKSDVASVNELVSSNFPAKVVSIKVSKGVHLKEGDTLLILEAMKMEAQVKAPRDCSVLDIFVHEGEMIPRGTKLVHLKFS